MQPSHTPADETAPRLLSMQALSAARVTPWKAGNELARWLVWPLVWLRFRLAGVVIGAGWRCYGRPIVQRHRSSTMQIGAGCELRSTPASNPLGPSHAVTLSTRRPDAALRIGRDFGMTGGAIVCEEAISIGDRVILGANCVVIDTDFHPLDAQRRRAAPLAGATAPVFIGDDVFVGMHSLVLKGVTIGQGSVIGAGSVVTRDVPAHSLAAGNPARVIRTLEPS
jgi:acetyltransferase-like isoleucine patch superfamily enzyme